MSYSYSDITMYRFDLKAMCYTPKILCQKRFRDYIFAVWDIYLQDFYKLFQFMKSIDWFVKIKFTISVANSFSVLEFLDLSLHINENNKVCVDVYAKFTNSSTYVLPSNCCSKKYTNKVSMGLHSGLEEYAIQV